MVYKTDFPTPEIRTGKAVLAFDGLDANATVTVNGVTILNTEIMSILERVDVTDLFSASNAKPNDLDITFDSTYLIGRKLVETFPDLFWVAGTVSLVDSLGEKRSVIM